VLLRDGSDRAANSWICVGLEQHGRTSFTRGQRQLKEDLEEGVSVKLKMPHKGQAEKRLETDALPASFRRMERREWWLWGMAFVVTLLVTLGLSSFVLPARHIQEDLFSFFLLRQAVRGLVALVLLFDVYTIYQQLQIHRMRRELFHREELFRLINENAADMIAIVDMEGGRIYNSMAYQKILGYSPEELKSSSAIEQIHPDDRDHVQRAAEEARKTGIGRPLEYRIRHKDGTWRVLESTSSVVKNAEGKPEKLIIVNRDISDRKRASVALSLSEASFRSVIENAPYGIYRANALGEFLRVNPALQKMLGYETQEALFRANLATDIYRDPQEHRRANDLFAGSKGFDVEVEWRRKDGTLLKARCSGRLIESGQSAGHDEANFEVFVEDVTEKRVLEQQLHMAVKMEAVGRLSGGIAHDFNNLLGVIIGYAQVLKRRLKAGEDLFEYAEEIEKAGQRAASLTRQLLAFSRQQVLAPAVLNLNALISDMGKMIHRLIGEDIELVMKLDPAIGSVKADHGQIEQVVMNLAVNARDAMPKGGKLALETATATFDQAYTHQHAGSKVGSYVMFSVRDTGMGMSAETLVHIFEPFFTTKELGKGTGLGLATVYGVVKQSGGYICVDSEIGHGSSFKVYLPLIEEPVQVPEAVAPAAEFLRGSETMLVVEDAAPLRKLSVTLLEQYGYRVLSAANGAEALELAEKDIQSVDLLLTDVIMPGLGGHALAQRLQALRPGLKVLYMSGYTDSSIAQHGVLEQGISLLHKPFTEEELVRKIREVLDAGKPSAPLGEVSVLVGNVTADRR
jgi:two-component system cell cycle sensor histidine kinase/response regulator CckA